MLTALIIYGVPNLFCNDGSVIFIDDTLYSKSAIALEIAEGENTEWEGWSLVAMVEC